MVTVSLVFVPATKPLGNVPNVAITVSAPSKLVSANAFTATTPLSSPFPIVTELKVV